MAKSPHFAKFHSKLRSLSSSSSKQSKRALCEEKQLSDHKANSESHLGVLDDAQRRDFNDVSYSTFTLMVPSLFFKLK